MFRFRKKQSSGSLVRRDGEELVYDSVGSGSSSSGASSQGAQGDEEQGVSSTAIPTTQRTQAANLSAQVDSPTRRVPDPWSTNAEDDQEAGTDGNFEGAVDGVIPTPQQAELMEAWLTKRRVQRVEDQHNRIQRLMDPRTGGFQQTSATTPTGKGKHKEQTLPSPQQPSWFSQQHPVDVDTGVEVIDKYDDKDIAKYDEADIYDIPTALATIIADDTQTVSSKPGSISSFPSAATSEMTPIASNKTYKGFHHRPSLGPSLSAPIEGPESGSQGDSEEGSSCCKQCAAFLDVRTWSGKVAFLLIIILVLAITTMVVSALLAEQSRSILNNNNSDESSDSAGDDVITRVPTTTLQPTMAPQGILETTSPTLEPTIVNDFNEDGGNGSPSPTTSPLDVSGTLAPTTAMPTQPPNMASTSAPATGPTLPSTAGPTTLAPTTAVPTASPSSAPSTSEPTSRAPTFAPTTLEPTSSPTASPSTAAPTVEPLEDLVLAPGDSVQGPSSDAAFGSSVALSGNGRVMVVGSPEYQSRNGRVDVFELFEFPGAPDPRQWVQRDVILGDELQGTLGQSVAVSFDGTIFAVSEPGVNQRSGRVTVYAYNPSSRSYARLGGEIVGSSRASYSGIAIAISSDGYRIAVGAPYFSGVNDVRLHGQVVVYELIGNAWVPMGNPISGTGRLDWLGSAIDMSDDGLRVVASAPRNDNLNGYVGAWEWSSELDDWVRWGQGEVFNEVSPAQAGDRFGHSISLSTTPEGIYRLAVGVPWKSVNREGNAGITVVFELDPIGNRWVQIGEPISQSPPTAGAELGSAVDLLDGRFLLIGIPGASNRAGEVRLYRLDEDLQSWEEHPVALSGTEPGDDFGVALAAQREVEINRQGISLVVGAINRGDIGYIQFYMEE